MVRQTVKVDLGSRDWAIVSWQSQDDDILEFKVDSFSGCSEFQAALRDLSEEIRLKKRWPKNWKGKDHSAVLMRELVLRAQNKFAIPYTEEELCHCRAVSAARVDQAIKGGCLTTAAVARATSAGTSCGTCKVNTQGLIDYRLKEYLVP